MQIPEHKIQEVLDRVDIVALVSRYVELKKAGRNYTGRCPFHQEKTPSFNVTPDRGLFYCFGCQAGGNAISFLQRYLGKSFIDTVKELAEQVGVQLDAAEDPSAKERQQLKEVTDFAARHFQARLWDEKAGRAGRAYLESRGFSEETSRAFGLGWSVNAWTDLSDAILKAGMLEWAQKVGLIAPRQRGDGFYDFFRGRLMIPIRSPEGRTIAFGGRLVEGTEGPKYFNSKESRLYNKGETLYALELAREEIRRRKSAILVEGYFDVIGLHQVGVKNTVALCSTALTAAHLGVLARADAKELVLLLDGDEAGRKAVERLAGPILAAGGSAKVALLPEGEDPDTFAQKVGADGVHALLGSARPLSEHLLSTLLPEGHDSSFEEKMRAVERLKPIAAAFPVGLVRSIFFDALSKWFGLPAAELEATLRGKEPHLRAVPKTGQSQPGAQPARKLPDRPPDALETNLVAAVLQDVRLLPLDRFRALDELSHLGLRATLAHVQSGHSAEDALFEANESVRKALSDAAQQLCIKTASTLATNFVAWCKELKLRRIEEQLTHIARVTGQVPSASELTEETRRLLGERAQLLALRKTVIAEGNAVSGGTKPRPQTV